MQTIESSLWIVGSLAASSSSSRDRVLKEGALAAVLSCMETKLHHRAATRLAAWAMSHICGGFPKPHLSSELVVPWLLKVRARPPPPR